MKHLYVAMCLCVSVTAYASCKFVTIYTPDGSMVVCSVCNDGKTIICN
jgi:hypothetical protein